MPLGGGDHRAPGLVLHETGETGAAPMTEDPATRKSEAQEPSMEDILASIRRVLAEDVGLASQDPRPDATMRPASTVEGEPGAASASEQDRAEANSAAVDPKGEALSTGRSDLRPTATQPEAEADPQGVFMLSEDLRGSESPLVSQEAVANSTDVLSQLARAILDRRDIAVASRDVTLEGMVREMLRPILREWLDRNLPYLVERLVKKEINAMINRAERLED